MKKKILPFVIGILIGAIITAAGFLIYEKTNAHNRIPNKERAGEMMNREDGEVPPDRPDGEGGMKSNRQKDNQNTIDSTSDSV